MSITKEIDNTEVSAVDEIFKDLNQIDDDAGEAET